MSTSQERGSAALALGLDDYVTGAEFSACRTYRYALWRIWNEDLPTTTWVMLNPSTADDTVDDPTIRRCERFVRSWGGGAIVVVNLFALRATDPVALYDHPDPVGPGNDAAIRGHAGTSNQVIAAWGNHGALHGRAAEVLEWLAPLAAAHGDGLLALRVTKRGEPGHPLYLPGGSRPFPFPRRSP